MTIRKTFVSFAAALICAAAMSEEQIVVKQADGWGASRDDAIQSACEEGVRQVNGFLFETEGTHITTVSNSSQTVNGDGNRTTEVASASSRETDQRITGAIKGYDIISCEQEGDGQWHVILTVRVAKYKTPGIDPNSRRKLVVAPFATLVNTYSIGRQQVSATGAANSFRDKLEAFLVQTRRFTVLGRQNAEEILAEKKLILRESADIGEYAKIGATLGTDYLVCGKITDIAIVWGRPQNMFTDNLPERILRARASLNYRILVMPTGQVKWTDDIVVEFTPEQIKALHGDEVAAYYALIDTAARAVCTQAMGNIYPVRAVGKKDNGEVILGEGGALHYEGELLDAYLLGEIIRDPYNGESLGREETKIATLQVVRVEAKLSYARILDGDVEAAAVKANRVLCRTSMAMMAEQPAEEPAIKLPTATEGIKLPFDK